jgi:hypothetical protein
VVAAQCALGATPGKAVLFEAQENLGDHRLHPDPTQGQRQGVEVVVETLDGLLQRQNISHPDVIKIDVQGSEAGVIAGMRRLLSNQCPLLLLLEFWPYGIAQAGGSARALFDELTRAGFEARVLGEDRELNFEQAIAHVPPLKARCPDHAFVNLVFQRGARQHALAA